MKNDYSKKGLFFLFYNKFLYSDIFEYIKKKQKHEIMTLIIYFLMKANKKDKIWMTAKEQIPVKRGQFITSVKNISEDTGITAQRIRTALNLLQNSLFLTRKTTNQYTLITILKFKQYQPELNRTNKQTNKQLTNEQQTTNKQLTITDNSNNSNYINDNNIPYESIKNKWNEINPQAKIIKLSNVRKKKIKSRWIENPELGFWINIFKKIHESKFLLGKVNDWKCNFDFVFENDTNYIKILEGKYESKYDKEKNICASCDGTGIRKTTTPSGEPIEIKCHKCKGSGYVTENNI